MNDGNKPTALHPLAAGLPTSGLEIERRSHQIIDRQLAAMSLDSAVVPIARRVIHATADFSFGESLRVHPRAVERAVEAIVAKRPIVCDVQMVQAGVTKTGCEVLCAVSRPEVVERAKATGCTRSAAAMELLSEQIDGAIVAIGNAPTALWKVLELAAAGIVVPAVVVGLPVGFVGAAESKQALMEGDLCYVSNVGPRGGSPVAAAAVNALAMAARRGDKHGCGASSAAHSPRKDVSPEEEPHS